MKTTKRPSRFAMAVMAGVISLGFSGFQAKAADVTIKHSKGETTFSQVPKKVLTFDLATLDTLTALGVDVAGVPAGNKPDYLSKYAGEDVAKIGTFFEPDYEAVNAAEPDLIIVAGRSSAKYADLAKIAPTIDLTVSAEKFLPEAQENVRNLGKIFGKQKEAEALLEKLAASTADLKAKAGQQGKSLLVLTTGGKMSSYGPDSRFGMLFSDYGFVPAETTGAKGTHGNPTSYEYILEKNPEWLFVIDRDAAIGRDGAARKMLDNDVVGQTTAWKNNHVVYLDPVAWYLVGGGITAMQKSVDQLSKAIASN
ncbi:siderophore ABC transporter substrate-binding protein [Neorhizobium sp. JUb45]|uniref:siderophore ABC transporter substrate-binding protein n=1 Tax=unclassified Neorhizobium TaxID=2629175 RepID=UPI001049ED28|nr:siderophore ABC transporter substrate-binding protein [Neorhizobium sp. JUb45]TCR03054.1 iron complex transport system substrate-binding protein [Neorhizobium sp. JUb45]